MYTSQQSTNFNQRVDLGNSYCNCFHLMPRVEKSTLYKSAALLIHTMCSAPVSTWKYSDLKTLSFSTRLHEIFSCVRQSECPLAYSPCSGSFSHWSLGRISVPIATSASAVDAVDSHSCTPVYNIGIYSYTTRVFEPIVMLSLRYLLTCCLTIGFYYYCPSTVVFSISPI